jgi:hypothetical protein
MYAPRQPRRIHAFKRSRVRDKYFPGFSPQEGRLEPLEEILHARPKAALTGSFKPQPYAARGRAVTQTGA